MVAFAFSGVYAIVDGLFVGRSIGDMGLAAMSVAYPITALIQAAGTGIGMGGAIRIAISAGRGDEKRGREYLGSTVLLLIFACLFVTLCLWFGCGPLLALFGAGGEIFRLSKQYADVIILGAVFQIMSTGLVPIIRNYDGALLAMTAMITGFVTNVILDYLFVMVCGYGMTGAALATLIGQAATMIICLLYLLIKEKLLTYGLFGLSVHTLKKIGIVAFSPFGLTLSPNLVVIVLNKGAFLYGGDKAVACYAVVNYVICVVQLLLQGVGDGCQPLLSFYSGAGKSKEVKQIRRLAVLFAEAVACGSIFLIYVFRRKFAVLFGVSSDVGETASKVLLIFAAGLVFAAFLRVTTSYFYAVKENILAYILIYGEPALLSLLAIFILPKLLGLNGIWLAMPVTQGVLTVVGIVLLYLGGGRRRSRSAG